MRKVLILISWLPIWLFLTIAQASPNDSIDAQSVLKGINAYRISEGLTPLKMVPAISAAAEQHSRDMAENKVPFGHDGFHQRVHSVFAQLKTVGGAAENVAYVYHARENVVNIWLNSPPHRRNIEGEYNLTGIGVARSADGKIFVTQIFVGQHMRAHGYWSIQPIFKHFFNTLKRAV